jgi:hypothetical protein
MCVDIKFLTQDVKIFVSHINISQIYGGKWTEQPHNMVRQP